MPADVIPAAALVAGPGHRIALDAGPAHHRPQERPRIGIVVQAVEGGFVRIHRELVALAGPGHVEFLHAATCGTHFPSNLVDPVLGPQPGLEAVLGQALHHLRQVGIAAAVAVVGQDPAAGHVVVAVFLRNTVDHVRGGAGGAIAPAGRHGAGLLLVVAVVVAIGITIGQRPARQQAGAAGQRGVAVEQRVQVLADEVIGVEAILGVQQAGRIRLAQVVIAIAPSVAQHAPALGGQQHRRRARAVALLPAAGIGDRQLAALELEAAVLLAAAEEALVCAARQHLHALLVGQIQRLQLAPQRNRLASFDAFQRQRQRCAADMQQQRVGADADFIGILLQRCPRRTRRLRQHDRSGLAAFTGQHAIATGLDPNQVIAQQADAQQYAAVGADVPCAGGHRRDVTQAANTFGLHRQGECPQAGQRQRVSACCAIHHRSPRIPCHARQMKSSDFDSRAYFFDMSTEKKRIRSINTPIESLHVAVVANFPIHDCIAVRFRTRPGRGWSSQRA